MNIDVVRIHFKDKGCDEYSYKYLPFEYCCDRLKTLTILNLMQNMTGVTQTHTAMRTTI